MTTAGDPRDELNTDIDDRSPEQQQVRSLLAGLPDPGPMPEDLVARIQARLAEEALRTASAHGALAPVIDLDSRRRRMRIMGAVAGVGAAAASAAVVGVLMTGGLHSLDHSAAEAVADFGPASSSASATAARPAIAIRLSDDAVSAATLDATATRLLDDVHGTPAPGTAESPSVGPLGTPRGLTDCLASQQAPAYSAVAADLTTFAGTPAVVIGLTTTQGERQAWVLDRSCHTVVPRHAVG